MKIKCSKCGIEYAVRPEIMEQRIKKFGSKEKLLKGYLCRDCRPKAVNDDKPQKTGSMAKAVKTALKANNIVALTPQQKRDVINARRRELRAQKKALVLATI